MNNNDSNINAFGEKIRAVFYFVDDLEYEGVDGYKDMCQKGKIELRTIVFAKKQRAIYKGGDMYCPMEDETFKRILLRMLDEEDVIDALIQFIKKHRNNLPIASREELGAIIVGVTLDIAENGTLNVNEESIKNIIKNYINGAGSNDMPKASKDQYGVVKIGDGINVDNGVISVKFSNLPSTTQDELLNLIYQFFQNKSNLRASTTQYGVVKVQPNGGILVNDGVISIDQSIMPSSLDQSIVSMTATRTGDQHNIVIRQNNNNNSPLSVDITSLVQNIVNNTEGGSGSGLNYAITDFVSNGTVLTISQNNNTDKSVNIENAVKQSIQNFIDNGDTIINNIGEKTQVSVDPILTSGTQIATITVDGTSTALYAPTGSGSGGGGDNPGGGGSEPYDDTDIKNAIRDLQDRANQTESDLRDLLDETEEEVREKFKNAFDTYEDLINYYKQSGDTTPTTFTFGKEDVDEWASQMGLITPNGDGTYNVGWSTLTQSYNSLAGEVAQIKANQSAGGEINYEALAAGLYAYIDENAATSGMDSTWGKFVTTDDDNIQMLEWMQAAIKTYASDQQAYSRLLAAARDYDENGDIIQEGIARIHALVEKDSNGNYVAGTSLASMIDDGVNNSLSEIFTENSSNSAVAGLYARLSDVEDTADDNYEAISGLRTRVEDIEGDYIAESELVSAITNKKDEIVSSASLATKASLEGAESSLSSQINGVSASIETCVKKDSNGVIESGVTLNADKINIDANHQLNLSAQDIRIDAEKVDNLASTIDARAANVKVKSLEAGSSNKIYVDSSRGVYVDGDCDSKIDPNGSGYLGNNGNSSAITWGTDGSGSIANGAISWDRFGSSVSLDIPDGDIFVGDTTSTYSHVGTNSISVERGSTGISMIGSEYGSGEVARLYVWSPGSSYKYTPTGPIDGDCDMRKKNVVEDENISIENIADAPLFKYTLKSNPEGLIKIGSSAQYWQNVIPEAVYSDDEGYLSLNYMTINTVASLTCAKELVKLKEENEELKERLASIEERIAALENK